MAETSQKPNIVGTSRPLMPRLILALLLFAAGMISLIYSGRFHKVPVLVEKGEEFIPPPPEIDPIEAMRMDPDELDRLLNPDPVIEYVMVPEERGEPVIVQGVTVGAYGRGESGEIEYLFGEGEELPEACPT